MPLSKTLAATQTGDNHGGGNNANPFYSNLLGSALPGNLKLGAVEYDLSLNPTDTATPAQAAAATAAGITLPTDVDDGTMPATPTTTDTTATTAAATGSTATVTGSVSWLTYGAIGLCLVGAYLLWRHLDNKI